MWVGSTIPSFFLLIEKEDLDEPIYSSVDKFTFLNDFEAHKQRLDELKISLPKGLLTALENDKYHNAGNERTVWEGDSFR